MLDPKHINQRHQTVAGITLITIILYLAILLPSPGCRRAGRGKILERKNISDITVHENFLYFGAGYNLCRIDMSTKLLETLYTTNSIKVEQPVVADGIVYFGGRGLLDKNGKYGDRDSFFAYDVEKKKILWRFKLDPYYYGTYGTYPILANENVIVCARRHLYCLDRKSGRVLWRIANWFGQDSDSTQIPYLYNNCLCYKLNSLKRSDSFDSSWAVASLADGKRLATFSVSKDTLGQGEGIIDGEILYVTTRYINPVPRNGYVGAIELKNRKLLWEVGGNFSRSRPAVNNDLVFTSRWNSIAALDKKNGKIVWEKPVEEITINAELAWKSNFPRIRSIRLAATGNILVARGGKGIVALNASNGDLIWSVSHEPDFNTTNPAIANEALIISNLNKSSVAAIDLKTGVQLWETKVPDTSVYDVNDY